MHAHGLYVCSRQILCMHGGLSPDLKNLEQIKRVARPTDVPDSGLLCDLLWADPDKDIQVGVGVHVDVHVPAPVVWLHQGA